MITFLTFADKRLKSTLKRIEHEARASHYFDIIVAVDEAILKSDKAYWEQYKSFYTANQRGFGYWMWKPYLIKKQLEKMNEGDILVYLDAGCEIHSNSAAEQRFQYYVDEARKNGIVCFDHLRCYIKQYCKGDVLSFFNVLTDTSVLNSKQVMAGILIMSKCKKTNAIIDEWYAISHEQPRLLNDEPSVVPNQPDFVAHRHDQSIFSILAYKYGAKILSQVEVYPDGGDWAQMTDFPFWAKRNKVLKKKTLLQRIIGRIKQL